MRLFPTAAARSAIAIISLIAVSSFTYASVFIGGFDPLGPIEASVIASHIDLEDLAPPPVLTVGSCQPISIGNIEVEGTGGTGSQPAGYPTLQAAFAAINAGVHTGVITIDVCGDTNEGTATASLNASGNGSASYISITMSPAGGVARTISGATTAGVPMIDLNGADNVTFDGLNSGGNTLTIQNTTASATSGTSTIRLLADATGNTITRTSILGSPTMAVGTNGGIVWLGTGSATGNDNNTISNNNIGPAGVTLPTKGIYINGTTSNSTVYNSGNIITNNKIFDYFGGSTTSAGIYVNGGAADSTISNNRFYQTAARTQTSGTQHSAIWTATGTSISGFQIIGNTIGFSSGDGSGTYTFAGVSGSVFIPISLTVGTATPTSVQDNTIAGIAMSGTASGSASSAPFRAINVNGLATVGDKTGNTIGSQTATGSITYTSSSVSNSDVIGIFGVGSSNLVTNNNMIGGITAGNTGGGASNIYGIRSANSSPATWTCQNNIVGGSVANSITATSTAVTTIVNGITNTAPLSTISGNTVRNLSNAGGTGTGTSASVVGILINTTSTNHTVSQNTIFNLSNSNTSAATVVTGIHYASSTGINLVERNSIYGLNNASTSAAAQVNGIAITVGNTNFQNNMVGLGVGVTNGPIITGINESSGPTDNFYFNSVYIGGTNNSTSGANTFAFNSAVTANVRAIRDNIFINARSNGTGSGTHYAISVANASGLTSNNNVLYTNGAGGVLGRYNSANKTTLLDWQLGTGQDGASFATDPQFIDPAGTSPNLHISPTSPTLVEGNGFAIAGVTDDFDGQIRSGLSPVDIGADAGNFTVPITNDLQATAFVDPINGARKISGTIFGPQASFTNNGTQAQTNVTVRYRIINAASVEVYNNTQAIASIAAGASSTVTFGNATIATPGVYTIKARSELGTDTVPGNDEITGTLTVISPFAVTSTSPVDGSTNVARNTSISVSFNRPAGASSITTNTADTSCSGSIQVSRAIDNFTAGTCVRMSTEPASSGGGTSFTVTPTSPLAGSTTYLIRVTTAALDGDGNSLPSVYTQAAGFTTKTAIAVVSTVPADGSTVSPDSAISVTFNIAADGSTVTTNTANTSCSGSLQLSSDNFATCVAMTGQPTASNGNTAFTVTPAELLVAGATYRIRMTTAASDTDGVFLSSDFTSGGFTVNSPPPVVEFSASEYSGPESKTVTVTVNRTGDLTGSSSVDYATSSGTATGGTCGSGGADYASTSGTLDFAASEASKTFTIDLCSDRVSEDPAESLGLSLSGATGATLGSRETAQLLILDAATQFTNESSIITYDGTVASPYPSTINVTGVSEPIGGLRLTLFDVNRPHSSDLYVLLVAPNGRSLVLMAGNGTTALAGAAITLEDIATTFMPNSSPGSPGIVNGQNYKPTNCVSTGDFPSPAPAGPYNEPGCGPVSAATFTSAFGGMAGNGTWSLYVFDAASTASPNGIAPSGSIGGWGIQLLTPTAARASISGRVTTAAGTGIRNAAVTVYGGALAEPRTVYTGSFGYYRIDELPVGASYVVSVNARRYTFDQPSRLVNLDDDAAGLDFMAEP